MKWVLTVAIAFCAVATHAKAKDSPKRKPAQAVVSPAKGVVTVAEKASICRAIEGRYHSTRWDSCRKAEFKREKDQVRVDLKLAKKTSRCTAKLKARLRYFDVTRLTCQ